MKTTFTILWACLLGMANLQAQSFIDNLFGNDKVLIERAIRQACFVVRQDYVLKDGKGYTYGNGGRDYFGRAYGIGVVSNGQLFLDAQVRQAWVGDVNYTPFKDSLEAIPFKTAWRAVDSTQFMPAKPWEASIAQGIAQGAFPLFRGAPQGEELPERGRLVVFYVEKGENPDTAQIQMAMAQIKGIQWQEDGTATEDQINLKGKEILGGVLFVDQLGPGSIAFEMVGLYVRAGNKWKIHKLPKAGAPILTPTPTPLPAPTPPADGGTGGKKKKKRD